MDQSRSPTRRLACLLPFLPPELEEGPGVYYVRYGDPVRENLRIAGGLPAEQVADAL